MRSDNGYDLLVNINLSTYPRYRYDRFIGVYAYTHIGARTTARMHTYIHTHTHAHTHIHIHTCIHTHYTHRGVGRSDIPALILQFELERD